MHLQTLVLLNLILSIGEAIKLPKPLAYEPYTLPIERSSYLEQFINYNDGSNWKAHWKVSNVKERDDDTGVLKFKYDGQWDLKTPDYEILKNDKGLIALNDAKLHGISTILSNIFTPFAENDQLVFQYEVKLQNGLECGGAYVKLLLADSNNNTEVGPIVKVKGIESAEQFSNETPYVIMFGPDKCGSNNKIHLILKDDNDVEHHLKNPPLAKTERLLSTLYTLVLKKNGEFEIRINGDVARAGNVHDPNDFDFTNEQDDETNQIPEFIDDPNDSKPNDWVDEEFILDPHAQKPNDWDESAPYLIKDPNAKIPHDWETDMPEQIPDVNHVKPDDWDDDEDGEWVIKLIDNPECLNHGCGEWIHPLIKNPNYKGQWVHPKIPNPDFRGHWNPRQIPNPDYVAPAKSQEEDSFQLADIAGIGFDLWTMNKGIMFNNIYLGHYINEAEDIGNSTFIEKFEAEHSFFETMANEAKEKYESELLKAQTKEKLEDFTVASLAQLSYLEIFDKFTGIVQLAIRDFIIELQMYVGDVVDSPVETFLQRPGEAVWFSSIVLGTLGSLMAFWSVFITVVGGLFGASSTSVGDGVDPLSDDEGEEEGEGGKAKAKGKAKGKGKKSKTSSTEMNSTKATKRN